MNNLPGAGSGNSAAGSNNAFISRRESRELRETRATANTNVANSNAGVGRGYSSGSFDFDNLIASLHDLFEQDRLIASQLDSTRCGICYLHFKVEDLLYKEEGFYICKGCQQVLGKQSLPMLRKQQK